MRKYPKTTGYYVYVHVLPNKDIYVGMSKLQPCCRWKPLLYKTMSINQHIEEYGWENIEHIVVQDGLTKAQAEAVEDWFIVNATRDGFCINKYRSGGYRRDKCTEYFKEYRKSEKWKEYYRQWYKKNKI